MNVRLTKNVVEIFFDSNRITSHPRLYGRPGQYSTNEEHMPPDHQKYIMWNSERFINWASRTGENTTAVVRFFLSSHKVEQQGYKSCMALLKLADKYSAQRRFAFKELVLSRFEDRLNAEKMFNGNGSYAQSSRNAYTTSNGRAALIRRNKQAA